eukprot:575038_1
MATEMREALDGKKPQDFMRTIGPAIGWIGVILAWCLQTGYGTPYLLELGVAKSTVNYVWLAGPVSGMIAQPIIGSLSDRIKRRRPFIIVGAITVFFTLIIFSNAQYLKYVDTNGISYAMIVAIAMFWINDFCINVLMVPLRALASDTVSSAKQIDAMSWFSLFGGIGAVIAFGFGSVISNVSVLYLIGAICVLSTCIITLKIVNSEENVRNGAEPHHEANLMETTMNYNLCKNEMMNIFRGIKSCPSIIWKLMLSQFLIFASNFPMWIYGTHFYGENLMKGYVDENNVGSDEYKLYQSGVKLGNFAMCVSGIIGVVFSYFIPKWFKHGTNIKGIKAFWMISFASWGIFGCFTPWIGNIAMFFMLHAVTSAAQNTAFHVFPWMFTSLYVIHNDAENVALILTIFNLSQCFPSIFMAAISGSIVAYFDHDVSSVLFVGGLFGILAAISVLFVDTNYKSVDYDALNEKHSDVELKELNPNDALYL